MANGFAMAGNGSEAFIGSVPASRYAMAGFGFESSVPVSGITDSGTTSSRWLPDFDVPVTRTNENGEQVITPSWGWFLNELSMRMGGIAGPSLPAVASSAITAVETATQNASDIGSITQSVNSTVTSINAITAVAIGAGLPGAGQIPLPQDLNDN